MTDIACWSCGARTDIGGGPPYECTTCGTTLRRRSGKWRTALDIESSVRTRDRIPAFTAEDVPALAAFSDVDEVAVAEHIGIDAVAGDASTEGSVGAPNFPRSMCSQCGTTFADDSAFCSRCGAPTVPPDDNIRIAALEQEVQALRAAIQSRQHRATESLFQWHAVSGQEKWNVTWGVWRRTILVNIALGIGFLIVLAAFGVLASL